MYLFKVQFQIANLSDFYVKFQFDAAGSPESVLWTASNTAGSALLEACAEQLAGKTLFIRFNICFFLIVLVLLT